MSHFRIYIPTRTLFGAGMVKELHQSAITRKESNDCYFKRSLYQG